MYYRYIRSYRLKLQEKKKARQKKQDEIIFAIAMCALIYLAWMVAK